jgi:tetratricopeptide (TPR) repeat protein
MTDEKRREGLEDIDWDEALAEWETTAFVPEVAPDVKLEKPEPVAASKPFYLPPSAPPKSSGALKISAPPKAAAPPKASAPPPTAAPPRAKPPAHQAARAPSDAPPPSVAVSQDSDDQKTIIASVPAELLRQREQHRLRHLSGGGLGQLFGQRPPQSAPPQNLRESAVSDPFSALGSERPAPATDEAPTSATIVVEESKVRGKSLAPAQAAAVVRPGVPAPSRTWKDEKAASAWLDDATRSGLEERVSWLEPEARSLADKSGRAFALIACSELLATLGERERAHALASEACKLAPSRAIGHCQARALMSWPPDPDDYLDSLKREIEATDAGPARTHATLLAVDAMTARGDEKSAIRLLDAALHNGSTDVRIAVARAARALGAGNAVGAAVKLPAAADLAPLTQAIAACLRLRGVEDDDAPRDAPTGNELLIDARRALDKGDLGEAALRVADLARLPELASGARWVAADLAATSAAHRKQSARWLRELLESGHEEARRPLAARALELGDASLIASLLSATGSLTSADRVALATLGGLALTSYDSHIDAAAATVGMRPLVSAATAVAAPPDEARAGRTAGDPRSRMQLRVGRLLSCNAAPELIEAAVVGLGDEIPPSALGIGLEIAVQTGLFSEVSRTIQDWGTAHESAEERTAGALAAALIAEAAGDTPRALEAYKAARQTDPGCEAALRAVASLESLDWAAEMSAFAQVGEEGVRSALARLEAVVRGQGTLAEATEIDLLLGAHRAAPNLPMAAFLAERIARRAGNVDQVLHWVRERRSNSGDPVEAGLDAVREALLVADRDPKLAGTRLLEAHRARPADVALRELYERVVIEPPDDGASWREGRAAQAAGDARVLFSLEAAYEYERRGDEEGALRCSGIAAAAGVSLGRIAQERAEHRTGRVARLADELLSTAKTAESLTARREACERLANLDASVRRDATSALLWHRSILEEVPDYKPSLRHAEHHLIGEGRDDELEPIASAIAKALSGTGAGECTAHAELAAHLRQRAGSGGPQATLEMIELAASEKEPSLASLRMLLTSAHARGDDVAILAAVKRVVDRSLRPAETAVLLVRAGEAALRLGQLEEARSLFEQATVQDPGDVVAWGTLAEIREATGDPRGAAEACESLARGSTVPRHQLLAWYEAGRVWQDGAADDDRALMALEAAAALDVSHDDVCDRLARLYAARKMQAELAELLERRIARVTDPAERLSMEVRRGRILLEAGELVEARKAFEVAMAEHPDDPRALAAIADLCMAQGDWDAAEQALVRLSRLLTTAEEQRDVYARLAELYSRHLSNLSRAEVALKEVLKRAPDDLEAARRLIDIYKRQNDPARALELQQDLVARAPSPLDKRARILELAVLQERTARDVRRAEKTLEAARREFPFDPALLRALADFYLRHQQTPAVKILLDRAGGDARRTIATGRLSPELFEVVATVFDLRGKKDAQRTAREMCQAVEGRRGDLQGAGERAFHPKIDDVIAPDALSPALRTLLLNTGDALDAVMPVDLRDLRASAAPEGAKMPRFAMSLGSALGLSTMQVLFSPRLNRTCMAVGSTPPTLVMGQALVDDERIGPFLIARALKLLHRKASALARIESGQLPLLVSAWLRSLNPSWQPPKEIERVALDRECARIQAFLPRNLDPDMGALALEVARAIEGQQASLGAYVREWTNRTALLALGDPSAALDAIAAAAGNASAAPTEPSERAAWIGGTSEARDLVAFALSESFALARERLGLAG